MRKRHTITLLSMLLIMVIEYQICTWTRLYGADTDVVSHVGFAGTIVSIVLAVIAILYSYFQTFAQQRDAGALAKRLEELDKVSKSLSAAADRNKEQTKQLGEIRDQIHEQLTAAKRTEVKLEDIHVAVMEALKGREIGEPSRPATDENEKEAEDAFDLSKLARYLVSVANSRRIAFFVAISYSADRQFTTTQFTQLIYDAAQKMLAIDNVEPRVGDALAYWHTGIGTGYLGLLGDLKLAGEASADPDREGDLIVYANSAFSNAVYAARANFHRPTEGFLRAVEEVIGDRTLDA